jgi:anti-sigma regulatory factor (Ser/Thr protein kinase)
VLGSPRSNGKGVPLKFTASVPGELRFRDLVGSMVRAVCLRVERDAGCSGLEWRLMSAYNEAFNNIVEHAYAVAPGDVEVVLLVDDEAVVLRMVDQGAGFNFEDAGASDTVPPFDTLSEGGMGLFIIRNAMSSVTYERRQNKNLLTMTKTLSECAEVSSAPSHGDPRC